MDEIKKNFKTPLGIRILIFLASLFFCLLAGSLVSVLCSLKGDINWIKFGQAVSSTLMFIVPPVVMFELTHRPNPLGELGFRNPFRWWMLLAGVVLMFVSLPLNNLLLEWNEKVDFGETLTGVLKMLEDSAGDLTTRILEVDTIGGLLVNLLVVALIPAIGEELTFRGALQQGLTRGLKNPHVAVFISAFVFSFIHFQFYGFLPRFFMGIILGYMFYYSGSIWTSILMHFANNGVAVVVAYLDYKHVVNVDWEHFGSISELSTWAALAVLIVSGLLTVGIILITAKNRSKYGEKQ